MNPTTGSIWCRCKALYAYPPYPDHGKPVCMEFIAGIEPHHLLPGGVDNWINLAREDTYFYSLCEIPLTKTELCFSGSGNNMRGFSQNIATVTTLPFQHRVTFPVFKYLANYRWEKVFFENFPAVTFLDVGSALVGTYTMVEQKCL